MKTLISIIGTLFTIALIICLLGWVFSTNFLIFDILLWLAVIILQVFVYVGLPILGIILILWVLNEIFN